MTKDTCVPSPPRRKERLSHSTLHHSGPAEIHSPPGLWHPPPPFPDSSNRRITEFFGTAPKTPGTPRPLPQRFRHLWHSRRPQRLAMRVRSRLSPSDRQLSSKLQLFFCPLNFSLSVFLDHCQFMHVPAPPLQLTGPPAGRMPRQPGSLQPYPSKTGRVLRFSHGYTPSLCARASRAHMYLR